LVAISGQSGAGKSTLLHIIASLDLASSGNILYDGRAIEEHTNFALSNIRLNNFGFVYQFHHLLEDLTVLENILIPMQILGKTSVNDAMDIINQVGLSSRINHLPWKLSGGEKQRVAIARALINNPDFIFLDEPTGNLDDENAIIIQNLLLEISKTNNIALVAATHDNNFIKSFDKIYYLKDFNLVEA
jgi:lipoprotein-releasing system ATP-binding protein